MTATAASLTVEAGKLLYGERWVTPLAKDLGVNTRTMERLAAAVHQGEDYGPARAWMRSLLAVMEKRRAALEATGGRILDGIDARRWD